MSDVIKAEVPGATDEDLTTITLAHPLSPEDLARLGIDRDAQTSVGTQIAVRHDDAKAIIGAGYAQVDSEDPEAVAAALSNDGTGDQARDKTGETATTDSKAGDAGTPTTKAGETNVGGTSTPTKN